MSSYRRAGDRESRQGATEDAAKRRFAAARGGAGSTDRSPLASHTFFPSSRTNKAGQAPDAEAAFRFSVGLPHPGALINVNTRSFRLAA